MTYGIIHNTVQRQLNSLINILKPVDQVADFELILLAIRSKGQMLRHGELMPVLPFKKNKKNKGQHGTNPLATKPYILPITDTNSCKVFQTCLFLSIVTTVGVITYVSHNYLDVKYTSIMDYYSCRPLQTCLFC